MYESILNFNKQFEYEPVLNGPVIRPGFRKVVVCGMGGSNLVTGVLKILDPSLDLLIHRNHGLPGTTDKESLVVLVSYSGNTEETIDAFNSAVNGNYSSAVIATGGKLLDLAKEKNIPHIQLPNWQIQPRMALGFIFRALLKVLGEEDALKKCATLAKTLNPASLEEEGGGLAEKLQNKIPIIYSSEKNFPIAYAWKAKLNETGKVPAFCNALPEQNHNELAGFERGDSTKNLSDNFHFVFVKDNNDDPRIIKRFKILEEICENKSLPVESVAMKGDSTIEKIFSSFILADWVSYYLAKYYLVDSEDISLIEDFKKRVKFTA